MPKAANRKTKKDWRKGIDTSNVERALDGLNEEEKLYGKKLNEQSNDDLFMIDVRGDEKVKSKVKKPLKSLMVLNQRSAVPTPSTKFTNREKSVNYDDKKRLNAIAKKQMKGPFGAKFKNLSGSTIASQGLSKAAKEAGTYNLWDDAKQAQDNELKNLDDNEGFEIVGKTKKTIKTPKVPHYDTKVEAIETPHGGQSYNPSSEQHEELLRQAYDNELQRKLKADEAAQIRRKFQSSKATSNNESNLVNGMAIDSEGEEPVEDDDEESIEDNDNKTHDEQELDPESRDKKRIEEFRLAKKKRKAALNLKKEKLERDRRAFLKSQKQTIHQASGISKALKKKVHNQQLRAQARKEVVEAKRRGEGGFEGRRIGQHVVPKGEIDVQLGDDLSESLRGMKVRIVFKKIITKFY